MKILKEIIFLMGEKLRFSPIKKMNPLKMNAEIV
jgi:hypothetical protein